MVDYANGVTIANPIVVNSNTTQLSGDGGHGDAGGRDLASSTGPRPLRRSAAGRLVLTAANTYSGATMRAVFAAGNATRRASYDHPHTTGGLGGSFAKLETTNLPPGFRASLGYTAY